MNKKLLMLIACTLFLLPGLSSATGLYCDGFVTVNVGLGTATIIGTPNVRWNPVPAAAGGLEYIYVAGEAGSSSVITIGAYDGDNNTFAFCTVSPFNPYYDDARHLHRQNGDGTLIYAVKGPSSAGPSNECTFLYTVNYSCFLH